MDLNSEEYFLSKPLSWLEFNKRVLEEAKDKSNPLLERMKYISITMSNLDEFVMVRVARFKDKIASGYNKKDKAGYRPEEHLQLISNKIHNLVKNTYKTYQLILANLEREDIYFKDFSELNTKHINYIDNYFKEIIQPVLTPMAVDKSRPFPHLANKSLNIAVYLKSKNPKDIDLFPNKEGNELFAVVRVPSNLNRLIELPTNGKKKTFIYIEDIIKNYSEKLFSGYNIIACASFRITRNADIEIQDNNQDLLAEMEEYIKKRQWGFPVRLEIEKGMNNKLRNSLINSLKIKENDLYVIPGPIDLTPIIDLIEIEGFNNLKFDPIIPQPPGDVYNENDYFDLIENKDLLLSHPYESFDFVINFIKKSANDPKVLAIKMTLYRISGDSPIIESLAKAAENGKQVTVLVELKARFDEEKNIEWAKKLEKAGCHVVYGLIGLKVHVKSLLVVRSESSGIKRYVHLSTGNYNDKTAKLYTDIGIFTSKEKIALDVSSLFNILTGYSAAPQWKTLSVAPLIMRNDFITLIDNEINQVQNGKNGHIIAKMNALVDKKIIKKLYNASQKGVKIDLIVRGICCLRPGVKGVSENIRVISIVGKLLEHSRIYYFKNGDNPRIFLSSADWRPRNLDRRVEVLFEVEQENIKNRLIKIINIYLSDNVKARELRSDGSYSIVNGEKQIESQIELYNFAKQNIRKINEDTRKNLFKY